MHDVRDEAERLNNDIQNLLDATRISSDGVRPHLEWADPADIINSALERCRRRLVNRRVTSTCPTDLPLMHVDPVLVQQALVQIFDNAAKYSPPGSQITVAARARDGRMIISVSDEGAGLTADEQTQMWDRFARGERHAAIDQRLRPRPLDRQCVYRRQWRQDERGQRWPRPGHDGGRSNCR